MRVEIEMHYDSNTCKTRSRASDSRRAFAGSGALCCPSIIFITAITAFNGSRTGSRRTGCLSILMFLAPLAEVTP